MFGPPPSPGGIAAIVAAGIVGTAQIATIAATRFTGSGGSISPPDITIPSGAPPGGGGGGGNGATGTGNEDVTTNIADLLNNKVEVSIVEIEAVGAQVNEIDDISTID